MQIATRMMGKLDSSIFIIKFRTVESIGYGDILLARVIINRRLEQERRLDLMIWRCDVIGPVLAEKYAAELISASPQFERNQIISVHYSAASTRFFFPPLASTGFKNCPV